MYYLFLLVNTKMKLYQKILTYSVIGLASLGISSCDNQNAKKSTKPSMSEITYFENFGEISEFYSSHTESYLDIELGDMDGDGDLDIILANKDSDTIQILENRIPQKSK